MQTIEQRSRRQWRDYLRANVAMQVAVVGGALVLAFLFLASDVLFAPSTASTEPTLTSNTLSLLWRLLIYGWIPATLTGLLVAGPLYALRGPSGKTTWTQVLMWGALTAWVGWAIALTMFAFEFDGRTLSGLGKMIGVMVLYGCPAFAVYGLLYGIVLRYLPGERAVPPHEPTLREKLTAGYCPPLDVSAWRVVVAFQGAIVGTHLVAFLLMLALMRGATFGELFAATGAAGLRVLVHLNLAGLFLVPLVMLRLWGMQAFPGWKMLAFTTLVMVVAFRFTLDTSLFDTQNATQLLYIYLPLLVIIFGVIFTTLLRWLMGRQGIHQE